MSSTMNAVNVPRLSGDDVRSIYNSIFSNTVPTARKDLNFHIVVMGSDHQRLSPPSFEYEDGLYLLLKSSRKEATTPSADDLRVSSNLKHLVRTEFPKNPCPWTLSGPQFPMPTKIQQRYCYPRGSQEYSNEKGGVLWSIYDKDGNENLTYRLLHVYHSTKRASTGGVYLAPKKRGKRVLGNNGGSRPRKKQRRKPPRSQKILPIPSTEDADDTVPLPEKILPVIPNSTVRKIVPKPSTEDANDTLPVQKKIAPVVPNPTFTPIYSPVQTKMTAPMQSTPQYKLTPPSPRPEGLYYPSIFSLSEDENEASKELDAFITPEQETKATFLPILPFNSAELIRATEGDKRPPPTEGPNEGANNNDISGITTDMSLEDTPNLGKEDDKSSTSPPETKSISSKASGWSRHPPFMMHPLSQWEHHRKQHQFSQARDERRSNATHNFRDSHDYQTPMSRPPQHDGHRRRSYPPMLPFRPHPPRLNSNRSYPPPQAYNAPRVMGEMNKHYASLDFSVAARGRDIHFMKALAASLAKTQGHIHAAITKPSHVSIQHDAIMMVTRWAEKLSQNPLGPPTLFNVMPRPVSMFLESEDLNDMRTEGDTRNVLTDFVVHQSERGENDVDADIRPPPSIVRTNRDGTTSTAFNTTSEEYNVPQG